MNEAIILTLRSGYGEFGMRRHAIRTGNYFAIPLELRIKLMMLCISSLIGTWSSIFCRASCTLKFP
jgi:hypothetical protein